VLHIQQQTFFGWSYTPAKIKSLISSEEKGDQLAYKNSKDLWENLPKMIESINTLKIVLKMEGEEKKSQRTPVSATSLEEED